MAGVSIYVEVPIVLYLSCSANSITFGQVVEVSVPMPTVYSEGDQFWTVVSFEFKTPIIQSSGLVGIIGNVNINFPSSRVRISGSTLDANSNLVFKMPKVHAEGLTGIVGDVEIILPIPFRCIRSEGIALVSGDVTMVVPLPIIESEAELKKLNEIWKSMVMNTSNYSITEYNQWRFNSYANIDGDFFGANSDGIHVLVGNLAGGERIESSFLTGLFDFNSDFVKNILQAWVVCRADGELTLRIRLGEKSFWENNLPVTIDALHEIRGKLAKGLKDRFFAFGIRNKDGSPYMVKSIRVIVDVTRSRPR